jgi:hypothetical protein
LAGASVLQPPTLSAGTTEDARFVRRQPGNLENVGIGSRLCSQGLKENTRFGGTPTPIRFWLSFLVVLYALAHLLPTVLRPLGNADEWMFGWEVSISALGIAFDSVWHGKPEWLFIFGWLPNPLFWYGVACLIIGRRRIPRLAGVASGSAGCAAVVLASLWLLFGGDARELHLGYYLWAVSMALLAWVGFWTALSGPKVLLST